MGEESEACVERHSKYFGCLPRGVLAPASSTFGCRKDWWVSDVNSLVCDLEREIDRPLSRLSNPILDAFDVPH